MNKPTQMKRRTLRIQSGIALPVVLIFLVVMLLLGATAIRNVTLGEKMAGNQRNQQLAFQAAESALRYCENAVQGSVPTGGPAPVKQAPAVSPNANLWEVADNWKGGTDVSIEVPRPADASGNPTDGLTTAPRCMVEDMADSLALGPTELKKDEQHAGLSDYRARHRRYRQCGGAAAELPEI